MPPEYDKAYHTVPSDNINYSGELQDYGYHVHVSSTQRSYIFMQMNAQKVPNKGNSFLHHFIKNKLDEFIIELNILPETLILNTGTIDWYGTFTCL
jgi:hypothetical protein